MAQRKDAAALAARESRMLDYIRQKFPAVEIARREGLQADYALKLRNQVALKHGLRVERSRRPDMPYGIDSESKIFRTRLGNKLWYLVKIKNLSQLELARTIGVPRKLQVRTWDKNPSYDWKLSEIQQLAKALGVPFKDFMIDLLEESTSGID